MKHIRGLDGLRAFAVLSVMLYHLGWKSFSLGWAGVPFFFVLSGFLITGILLESKGDSAGHFFRTFYIRRALRIFPLYFLVLGLVCWWVSANHGQFPALKYFLTYTQNYYLAATNFAWASGSEIGHTWSLAVEEQFYLLWPFAVYFLSRRTLVRTIFVMIAVAVVSRWWLEAYTKLASFAPLTSNLDSLGLGAMLAIMVRKDAAGMKRASMTMGVVGVAVIVICIAFKTGLVIKQLSAGNQLLMAGISVASAGIIGFTSQANIGFLDWKPLAYIGKISYGLYVWHAPAYIFLDIFARVKWYGLDSLSPTEMVMAKLTVTFAVSMLSYHLMERPLLKLKNLIKYGVVNQSGIAELAPSSGLIERAQ
ncbi:O-acetyltransferase OatA [Ralstonia mannitolilytica]|uniref:acyltransferase family protein n=1 Tax=Ralstonia mannitolilytica TaxID=105219 RepID=UPI0028F53859|nr:acyltransferase [Ralstonia mannitolilytica]CAJ0802925.1 O-acetyltransferase OatA [Ralstonia mannitolilytica]